MKKIIFLILISFLFSCERDIENSENLIGKWNWVKSTSGFEGIVETPSSTGKNIAIEFSRSKVKIYENGILESEKNYKIQTKKSEVGGKRRVIVYDPYQTDQSFFIENNTLILSDECLDCLYHEYVRE